MLQEFVVWSDLVQQRQRSQFAGATGPVIKLDFDWEDFATHAVFARRMDLQVYQIVELIAMVQYRSLVVDNSNVLSCIAH